MLPRYLGEGCTINLDMPRTDENFLEIIKPALIPFSLAFFFTAFIVVYRILGLPQPVEMADHLKSLYQSYGMSILLFAAFVEGIFMVNIYFPGSFVIVVAIVISEKTPTDLIEIVIASWLGFMVAMVLNYFLGKTGIYRTLVWMGKKGTIDNMQRRLDKYGSRVTLLAGIHPNFMAIAAVCMGISASSLPRFLARSGVSLLFWSSAWAIFFAIALEHVDVTDQNQHLYIIAMLLLWGVAAIIGAQIRRKG